MTTAQLLKNANRPECLALLKERIMPRLNEIFGDSYPPESYSRGIENMWRVLAECGNNVWHTFDINDREYVWRFYQLATYFCGRSLRAQLFGKAA